MKDNPAPLIGRIRNKSQYDFSNLTNISEDPKNFFFLSDYYDNKNTIYTLNSVFKFINKKYLKNNQKEKEKEKSITIQQKKEKEFYLPNIVLGNNKEKEIETTQVKPLFNNNDFNSIKNIKIEEEKFSFLNNLNLKNDNWIKNNNKKILINPKLIFSNSILENACKTIGIDNRKKEGEDDLNLILANNNSFYFNKFSSNAKSFEGFSQLKNKENIYLNNNNNNCNFNNNSNYTSSFTNETNNNFKKLKILKNMNTENQIRSKKNKNLENYSNENTNNNSIEETEIGVIGLFSPKNFDRKTQTIKNKLSRTNERISNLNSFANANNTCFGNSKSVNPIKQKSIEFELIKNANIFKSDNRHKVFEINFKGLIQKNK